MKKGQKAEDVEYSLVIKDLHNNPIFTTTSFSLRALVREAAEYVPNLDTHSKIYREMRESLGVYIGVFLLSDCGKPRHAVVTITRPHDEADIARFHAIAATLPEATLPFK